MARQFVDEGSDVYRVCVTYKKVTGENPAYDWRTTRQTGEPQYLYSETETETKYYGPYKSEGVAKGQLSFRMQYRPSSDPEEIRIYPGVISGHVEKANIMWEVVGGLY
jgi:hypothetical protein